MVQSVGRLQDKHVRRRGEVRRPEAEHLAASGRLAGWLAVMFSVKDDKKEYEKSSESSYTSCVQLLLPSPKLPVMESIIEVCSSDSAPSKRKHQEMASSSATSIAEPERKIKRRRGKKERLLTKEVKTASQKSLTAVANATSIKEPSILEPRRKQTKKSNEWTINYSENRKLWMSKRRSSSYRPEDLEAFFRLLEDSIIQRFLEDDNYFKGSDKYLLSMLVEYFGRVGLPGHLYNRIHFFLALYIASEMEEADPTSQWIILQSLLGRENMDKLRKEFLKLRMEFFQAMEYRAWVSPELCEEIQAQNPQHWVWRRVRQCTP
ncbi:putative speedy protein E7 [Suncus etruscus]|uniref:putative speedy protein E7 n=1 Tax=Suncus etruscus TaxID=109475 RepID=UPI002110A418|nr:putative speedy protein E7 [Suncus etruscus]